MVVVVAMTTADLVVVGAGGQDCVACEWRRRRGRMRMGLPWGQREAGRREIGAGSPRGQEILLPALTLKYMIQRHNWLSIIPLDSHGCKHSCTCTLQHTCTSDFLLSWKFLRENSMDQ